MRTLWVCNVAGGPFEYSATKPGSTPIGLEEAHRESQITPEEFDEVAAELGRSLDFFEVPQQEKEEVLAAFSAHKPEVIEDPRQQQRVNSRFVGGLSATTPSRPLFREDLDVDGADE